MRNFTNYKYFSYQSSSLLLLLEVSKNHYKKENASAGGSEQCRKMLFLNSFKTDLVKLICADLGKSEFLNIHILSWYKALYLACSSISRHVHFIRALEGNAGSYVFINT